MKKRFIGYAIALIMIGCIIAIISYSSIDKSVYEKNLELLAEGEITILDCDHVGAYCEPDNQDDMWCIVEATTQTLLCRNMKRKDDEN